MFQVKANIIGSNDAAEAVAEFATRAEATAFAQDQNSAYGNTGDFAGAEGNMNFFVTR